MSDHQPSQLAFSTIVLAATLLTCTGALNHRPQEPVITGSGTANSNTAVDQQPAEPAGASDSDSNKSKSELTERVKRLEERLDVLEGLLFSGAKLEETRAQRALDDSLTRLENSRSLFVRGLISEALFQIDEAAVERAKRELELAKTQFKQRQMVSKLELVEAKEALRLAIERRDYQRLLASRGFATRSEVQRAEQQADEAEKVFDQAKRKLEAAEKLESIDK